MLVAHTRTCSHAHPPTHPPTHPHDSRSPHLAFAQKHTHIHHKTSARPPRISRWATGPCRSTSPQGTPRRRTSAAAPSSTRRRHTPRSEERGRGEGRVEHERVRCQPAHIPYPHINTYALHCTALHCTALHCTALLHMHMHGHVHTPTPTHTLTHTHRRTPTCAHTYTHTHPDTHTHMHTATLEKRPRPPHQVVAAVAVAAGHKRHAAARIEDQIEHLAGWEVWGWGWGFRVLLMTFDARGVSVC